MKDFTALPTQLKTDIFDHWRVRYFRDHHYVPFRYYLQRRGYYIPSRLRSSVVVDPLEVDLWVVEWAEILVNEQEDDN